MKVIYVLLLTFLMLFFCRLEALADAARLSKEAKRLYLEEKYDEAAEKYKEAVNLEPDSDIMHFDAGAALYKKKDYENAIGESQKALSGGNRMLETKAAYNIGNSKYRLGRLEESLDYYKRVIELDEKDEDAKFNYEFVKRKLEENQQPRSQKEQKKEQEKKEQDKEQDKDKKKEQDEEQKKNKDKKGAEDNKEVKKGGENEKSEEEKEKEKEEKQRQEKDEKQEKEEDGKKEEPRMPEPQEGGMSEKEARMLLEGHAHEEESMGNLQKKKKRRLPEVLKDW